MQSYSKYFLTIAFCIFWGASKSQLLLIDEYTDSCIKSLQIQHIDTLILFSANTHPMVPGADTIKSIGPIAVFSNDYLLYTRNSVNYIQKIIKGSLNSGTTKSVISKPLILGNDSLYRWLTSCISKIEAENLLPFICKYKLQGQTVYDKCLESDSYYYEIVVYAKNESFKKFFQEFVTHKNLMENFPKLATYERENLNYNYNIQTTLFKFYRRLKQLTETIDSCFNFEL